MTWTCAGTVGHFTIFHNELRAPCGRPQCVLPPFAETCSSNSSISYHIISVVNALQAVAQLGDAFIIFCIVRDEHLPIDRSICQSIFSFFRLACCCCCWLRLPYTAAIFLAATSKLTSTGWRWWARSTNALASGEAAHLLRHH